MDYKRLIPLLERVKKTNNVTMSSDEFSALVVAWRVLFGLPPPDAGGFEELLVGDQEIDVLLDVLRLMED